MTIYLVTDCAGHGLRYAIDASKLHRELDWQSREIFESGLRRTVRWYLENTEWTQRVMSGAYHSGRLGTAGVSA